MAIRSVHRPSVDGWVKLAAGTYRHPRFGTARIEGPRRWWLYRPVAGAAEVRLGPFTSLRAAAKAGRDGVER